MTEVLEGYDLTWERQLSTVKIRSKEEFLENARKAYGCSALVISALATVDRAAFLPQDLVKILKIQDLIENYTYAQATWPYGEGSTISEPEIVALMAQLLLGDLESESTQTLDVLEIGSGSGYQAGALSEVFRQARGNNTVSSITAVEYDPELATFSERVLIHHGYADVDVLQGDGFDPDIYEGKAFDRIMISASVPPWNPDILSMIPVLKPGGRLICPVGGRRDESHTSMPQLATMCSFTKGLDNVIAWTTHGEVVFVPLQGVAGWENYTYDSGVLHEYIVSNAINSLRHK